VSLPATAANDPCDNPPMQKIFQSRAVALLFLGMIGICLLVGAIMIERSSTVAVDGRRYFAIFDDGMISMRYADNLVSGRGLVWNPGERVEGFSSPLWVFVLAGFVATFGRGPAVAAVQIFGLLLVACDLVLVVLVAGRLLDGRRGRDLGAIWAALLTMTFYPLFYWSIMGMETGLLVPVLLLAVLISLGGDRPRDRRMVAVLLSLGCLLRPETLLFALVHYVFDGMRRAPGATRRLRPLAVEAGLFLAPLLAYQAFRIAYYGGWIANSHRLKLGGLGFVEQCRRGWSFCEPFLLWSGWLALAVGLFLIVGRQRGARSAEEPGPGDGRLASFMVEFLVLFMVYVGYQIVVGGDAWPLYVRFPVPATVLLIVAFAVAVVLAFERLGRGKLVSGAVLGITFLLILRWTVSLFRADVFTLTPIYSRETAANINVALAVDRFTDESATVASFSAGVIPYYSRRRAIDPLGKCDATIAALPAHVGAAWHPQSGRPGHDKYDLDYSLKSKRPTAIQLPDLPPCTWGEQDLSRWCQENYFEVYVAGSRFLLDKHSPLVRWDMMRAGKR
jgi:arabinofuranosyltransferase